MTLHNWFSGLAARALWSCRENFDGGGGRGVVVGGGGGVGKFFFIVLMSKIYSHAVNCFIYDFQGRIILKTS